MKALLAQINPVIGDIEGNGEKVLAALNRAKSCGASLVVFPELTLVGYFPGDLLFDEEMIEKAREKLEEIASATKELMAVIGLPRKSGAEKPMYNSAAICMDGKIVGFQDKTLLPTYDVFDERRYFEPGKKRYVWTFQGRTIAVSICEDLWQHAKGVTQTNYAIDPVDDWKGEKIDFMINLSGSPYSFRRKEKRVEVFSKTAKSLHCPLLFCNQVGANDELIFDGHSFVLNKEGNLSQIAKGFVEDDIIVDLDKDLLQISFSENDGIADLYCALILGVKDYYHKQGLQKGVVGLSGGVDSALVAKIACEALGNENITGIALPTRYNSEESLVDAKELAQNLGIAFQVIPIDDLFEQNLKLFTSVFGHFPSDITVQNIQARIRGMVLMAFSNEKDSLVLNTNNKSEMAVGFGTLYGDMIGALGVLQDVTKEKVYLLAQFANIPEAILKKAPSAELKENQTDQDTLPPYEWIDKVIDGYLEKGEIKDEAIIKKLHQSEYKRRQVPIGLRVTEKAFGKGRQVPIVQKWR